LIPSRSESASKEIFALAFAVAIGGIEKRDARFDSRIDNFRARLCIDAPAEIVAAKSDNGNFERTNLTRLHWSKMK
jgi:hypothetical protein